MRLIDADAFARWLDKEHYVDKPTGKCDDRQNRVLGIAISAAKNPEICPTIDAVPVVRCRYCEEYESDCGYCDYWETSRNFDDYCSLGKRKMDGGEG